mgnify:CR=1 FL=1
MPDGRRRKKAKRSRSPHESQSRPASPPLPSSSSGTVVCSHCDARKPIADKFCCECGTKFPLRTVEAEAATQSPAANVATADLEHSTAALAAHVATAAQEHSGATLATAFRGLVNMLTGRAQPSDPDLSQQQLPAADGTNAADLNRDQAGATVGIDSAVAGVRSAPAVAGTAPQRRRSRSRAQSPERPKTRKRKQSLVTNDWGMDQRDLISESPDPSRNTGGDTAARDNDVGADSEHMVGDFGSDRWVPPQCKRPNCPFAHLNSPRTHGFCCNACRLNKKGCGHTQNCTGHGHQIVQAEWLQHRDPPQAGAQSKALAKPQSRPAAKRPDDDADLYEVPWRAQRAPPDFSAQREERSRVAVMLKDAASECMDGDYCTDALKRALDEANRVMGRRRPGMLDRARYYEYAVDAVVADLQSNGDCGPSAFWFSGGAQVIHIAVSMDTDVQELIIALASCPFECTIVQPTPGGFSNAMLSSLRAIVNQTDQRSTAAVELTRHHTMHELFPQTFICLRENRVRHIYMKQTPIPQSRLMENEYTGPQTGTRYLDAVAETAKFLEDAGGGNDFGQVQAAVVQLYFRQRKKAPAGIGEESLRLLVVYVPTDMKEIHEDALVDIIFRKNVIVACGSWGKNGAAVQRLAHRACAAGEGAMTFNFFESEQRAAVAADDWRHTYSLFHYPNYFIVFGETRRTSRLDTRDQHVAPCQHRNICIRMEVPKRG